MARFVWSALVVQLAVVVAAHFAPVVLLLSGILGTLTAFVFGLAFGATRATDVKTAARGGLVVGLVGALAAGIVAVLLKDQPVYVLSYAPLSAAITGLLGAIIGMVAAGRAPPPAPTR